MDKGRGLQHETKGAQFLSEVWNVGEQKGVPVVHSFLAEKGGIRPKFCEQKRGLLYVKSIYTPQSTRLICIT